MASQLKGMFIEQIMDSDPNDDGFGDSDITL